MSDLCEWICRLSYVLPEEWVILSASMSVDTAIEVQKKQGEDGQSTITVTPGTGGQQQNHNVVTTNCKFIQLDDRL